MSDDNKPYGSEDGSAPGVGAPAMTSADKTPIWSDNGDAPFVDDEDDRNTPKAARVKDDPESMGSRPAAR